MKRDLEQSGTEVRVMTAHGAKGLQSRIVFLADTCSIPSQKMADKIRWGNGFVLWPTFKENEEAITAEIADIARTQSEHEYRRLLYVAMTRAEDRLYICGWKGIRDIDENCWYRLIEKGLKDLPDTQIIDNAEN